MLLYLYSHTSVFVIIDIRNLCNDKRERCGRGWEMTKVRRGAEGRGRALGETTREYCNCIFEIHAHRAHSAAFLIC